MYSVYLADEFQEASAEAASGKTWGKAVPELSAC